MGMQCGCNVARPHTAATDKHHQAQAEFRPTIEKEESP
jgi:hypothetical protein